LYHLFTFRYSNYCYDLNCFQKETSLKVLKRKQNLVVINVDKTSPLLNLLSDIWVNRFNLYLVGPQWPSGYGRELKSWVLSPPVSAGSSLLLAISWVREKVWLFICGRLMVPSQIHCMWALYSIMKNWTPPYNWKLFLNVVENVK
jgi:hypothetical protein